QNISEATSQKIDSEVRRLVEDGLNDARRILTEKAHELEALARGLLEYETLTGDEIRNLLDGQPPVRDDGDMNGAKHRTSRPAVPSAGAIGMPKPA
ncbi:cell division protein FtsH, partial [Microvirga sp. 3-52]|nr:cell division protein FtsH [Microvirga sp. 3-52]